jgi:pimeloyl-ACP methyl ester carboxylesterase
MNQLHDPSSDCAAHCPLAGVPNCHDHCPAHAPQSLPPLDFREATTCFQREAQHGVCDTSRYRLPYFIWGSGPPLLFIHGVSDHAESFVQPIARLSAHFRCIAYNLPTGRNDGARISCYTHADLVRDLWALLDHLGAAQSYVFGSSFGATVALAAMREQPRRLPRGVLQSALAWRPLRRTEKWLAHLLRFLPGTMRSLPYRTKILTKVHGPMFDGRGENVWQSFVECTGRTPFRAFGHQVLMLDRTDVRPWLADVKQPVLLVCGERDPLVGAAQTEALLRGLPNAGRVVIEGGGHMPYYTHPEVLAEVVRRFLTPPLAA